MPTEQPSSTVTVHTFPSSAIAYDASQSSDDIRDGDVLAVPSEASAGVYAVVVGAWPIAVTEERGSFHLMADGIDWAELDGGRYVPSYDLARELEAREGGYRGGTRELGGLAGLDCEWFAFCDRAATVLVGHPVIGWVPACDRCADRSGQREGGAQ